MHRNKVIAVFAVLALLSSCTATSPAKEEGVKNAGLTVGLVQREISVGMNAVAVAEALGSPNIVKKSAGGGETWIYDKFSSEQVTERAGGTIGFASGDVAAAIGGSSGKNKTTSTALTVIIKFDSNDNVSSLSYHRSKF